MAHAMVVLCLYIQLLSIMLEMHAVITITCDLVLFSLSAVSDRFRCHGNMKEKRHVDLIYATKFSKHHSRDVLCRLRVGRTCLMSTHQQCIVQIMRAIW